MTYKEALDILLTDVKQKASAYITAVEMDSRKALAAWEEAEQMHNSLVLTMRRVQATPDDIIPEHILRTFPKHNARL